MLINVLVYFYVKTAPSTWNISPPSSPATPIWKLWSCQAYPPFSFKKFVGDWTPQQKWRGSHYISLIYNTYLEPQKLVIFGLQLCPINHKNCRSWNLKTHISSDNPISMWLRWMWNSAFWLEVENLRKLEIIFSCKPLPSLSQENRKTLPSALLDTSTT